MIPLTRPWLRYLALLLALGFVGCSSVDPQHNVVVDADYPCGPFMYRDGLFLNDHVIAWTPDGSQLLFNYGTLIWVVDAQGTQLRPLVDVNPAVAYSGHLLRFGIHLDISPDGTRVVFTTCEYEIEPKPARPLFSEREAYHYEIAVIHLDGTGQQRLTVNPDLDHYPVWSPDGSRIAYIGERPDEDSRRRKKGLYTMAADGSDVRQPAVPSSIVFALNSPVWSPDGESLMLEGYEGGTSPATHIYLVSTEGSQLSRIPVQSPDYRSFMVWSPTFDRLAAAKLEGEELTLVILAADPSNPMLLTKITHRSTFERRDHPFRYGIRTILWAPEGTHILFTCEPIICVVNVEDGQVIGVVEEANARVRDFYYAAWVPDGSRITIYTPGDPLEEVPPELYTIARDGTDRRDLIRLDDDGNLVPANPPKDE